MIVAIPFYWLLGQGDTASDFGLGPGGIAACAATAGTVSAAYSSR